MPSNSKLSVMPRRFLRSDRATYLVIVLLSYSVGIPLAFGQDEISEFPASWFGMWKGESHYVGVGRSDTLHFGMELHVGPRIDSTRAQWKIVYVQNGERQERPYSLVTIDPTVGRYLIDEHNSITIPSALLGETLFSHFAVGGVQLTTSYQRDGEHLLVEMLSIRTDTSAVSGGVDDVPEVTTYPIRGIQRAMLTRVKE